MNHKYDAIIIGAGHNGLVTAGYLAKTGLRVLVLERRAIVGGVAVTEEIHPGFKVDSCVHGIGWLHPGVVRDLKLRQFGLEIVRDGPSVFAPLPDGDSLLLWPDATMSKESIRKFSHADAERWDDFCKLVAQVGTVLEVAYSNAPPDVTSSNLSDLGSMIKIAGRLRRMGGRDMTEVMRALPMPVTDFLDEWFETDVLKGTLAASGITGIFQGPKAPGTAFVLFHHHTGSKKGYLRSHGRVRGGIGTLANALAAAAKQHGAEIRTGAEIDQILVTNGRATGVVLASGEQISARIVVSSANPRSTFLDLVGALELDHDFLQGIRNIKFKGAVAKVNLGLNQRPNFSAMSGEGPHLRGAISISPSMDYLERAYDDAKYGAASQQPYLEAVIPSLSDPSLAPDGKHVMSVFVQYAPYHLKEGTWDDARREALLDTVIETLAEYAPNLKGAVEYYQVLTPLDLEQIYDLPEGNLYHGDLTLDQVLFMRPVPGWAQYRTPIENLYLCGAGTHPGGGLAGAPGYNAARAILKAVKR